MPRPLVPFVAVAADYKEIDGYRWHAAAEPYLQAVIAGVGGIPLILPAFGEAIDLDALLDGVDGVLLPGSRSNVHPALYGDVPSIEAEPYDRRRDATSLPLIHAALRRGVPLFAICRGMQELNVALGGTLVPEVHRLAGRQDHRAPPGDDQDLRFAIRQDVAIVGGGTLEKVLGSGPVQVNSLHRQAIGRLADRLAVEALAPDGTIEAVRVMGAPGFAIGVQWHPEYWVASDRPSARLFAAFADAIRARMIEKAAAGNQPLAIG
jgi:putative glutamine amidotransferase